MLARVVELELEGLKLFGEGLGPLPMAFATGGEIADADLKGFAFGFARGGFGLPGLAGAKEFGDEKAGRGEELGDSGRRSGGHGASCQGNETRFGQ